MKDEITITQEKFRDLITDAVADVAANLPLKTPQELLLKLLEFGTNVAIQTTEMLFEYEEDERK